MKTLTITEERIRQEAQKGNLVELTGLFLFTTGYVKILFSGFPKIEKDWWIYAFFTIVITGIWEILFRQKRKKQIITAVLAVLAAVVFGKRSGIANGLGLLANDFLDYLTGRRGEIFLDLETFSEEGKYFAAALILAFFAAMTALSLLKKRRGFCFGITFLCCIGCGYRLFLTDYGLALLLAGMVLLIAGKECQGRRLKGSFLTLCSSVLVLAICILTAAAVTLPFGERISFEKKIMEGKDWLHKREYDSGTNAMPEGNLSNLGSFEKTEEAALLLKTKTPEKLYLRGRIGEVYTGLSWEEFDSSVYKKGEDLFYWLHKTGFYGQTMLSSAMGLEGKVTEQELEITNISGCQEIQYLPYTLSDNSVLLAEGIGDDKALSSVNIRENQKQWPTNMGRKNKASETEAVSFRYLPGSLPQWYETALWLSENQENPKVAEYLKQEESYREFVYENNLQLTNTAIGTLEGIFEKEERKERALLEILTLVQETLEEKMSYEEAEPTFNGTNDFLKFTLEQKKSGYSPHYATAATLMLRYLGVPARYVEGYFLSSKEAAEYEENQEILLTEGHAHAWTEYYMDGIGWIPFEVTPGYIDEEEWAATGTVIADGKGEALGRGFAKSSLTYTPPKLSKDRTDLSNLRSWFRFEIKDVLYLLLFLGILLLLFVVFLILKRCLRLKRFWNYISSAENKDAVIELYGYGNMLLQRLPAGKLSREREKSFVIDSKIQKINDRARFGAGNISQEERVLMEEFTKEVIYFFQSQCSFWEKIKYHFILWIY